MKNLTLLIKPAAGLCNMNCGYCFYRALSGGRENRIMSRETADLLIEKIAEYDPRFLSVVFQGGEPTLAGAEFFDYFAGRLTKALKSEVMFSIQTNGLLIDRKFVSVFKKYDFLVGVSIDGKGAVNDRYRRDNAGNGVLPQALSAVNLLRKNGIPVNILSVIDDKNAGDIETTYKYFKKQGFDNVQFIPYVDECEGVSLSPENYEMYLKRLFDLWYADFDPDSFMQIRHLSNYLDIIAGYKPENCAMCGVCGGYLVIEANGDIYPCDFYCGEEYKTGNISDENPFEINEKHREFIEQSKIIHEHCSSCKYYSLCRGACRRERINGLTENKYCRAYYNFFEYAYDRLEKAVKMLSC